LTDFQQILSRAHSAENLYVKISECVLVGRDHITVLHGEYVNAKLVYLFYIRQPTAPKHWYDHNTERQRCFNRSICWFSAKVSKLGSFVNRNCWHCTPPYSL